MNKLTQRSDPEAAKAVTNQSMKMFDTIYTYIFKFSFLNYISYTSTNTKETQKEKLVNMRHSNKVTQTHTYPKIKYNNLNIR